MPMTSHTLIQSGSLELLFLHQQLCAANAPRKYGRILFPVSYRRFQHGHGRRVLPPICTLRASRLPLRSHPTNTRAHPTGMPPSRSRSTPPPQDLSKSITTHYPRLTKRLRSPGQIPYCLGRVQKDIIAPCPRPSGRHGRIVFRHVPEASGPLPHPTLARSSSQSITSNVQFA
jgi:hypothetical protein